MHTAFSLGQSLIDGVVTQTDGIYVGLSMKKAQDIGSHFFRGRALMILGGAEEE